MSNPNQGMGNCFMGSSRFGYGNPATQDPIQRALLRRPDGTLGDCALLDPASADYVLDADGNNVGGDSLEQRVYLALRTVLGSSAVATLGIVPIGGVITDDLAARNTKSVNAALKGLTDANAIRVLAVTTTRLGQSAIRLQVTWQAVTTGQIINSFV